MTRGSYKYSNLLSESCQKGFRKRGVGIEMDRNIDIDTTWRKFKPCK